MSSKVVSVIDTGYESFEVERKILGEKGYTLQVFDGGRHDIIGKKAFAENSEGILMRWSQVDNDFLKDLPKLKAICRYGVGYDNINLEHARQYGVKVANVSGYASHSVSDHTLMLLFSVLRDLHGSEGHLRKHYTQPGRKDSFELHEKTLGIIGLGRIGSMLCNKAKPLFKHILAYDPYILDEKFNEVGAQKASKEEILRQSDVISIHCNLSTSSENLIDSQEFELMEKKPILINTARGGIVNEEALMQALKEDKLFGVGIDVFKEEPPLENLDPLFSHPNVIATGHNAWYSKEAQEELQLRAAKNMVAMLLDEPCEDLLT
ncbi:MAG: C-terminal binding protein [Bacteroidota bacterium]